MGYWLGRERGLGRREEEGNGENGTLPIIL